MTRRIDKGAEPDQTRARQYNWPRQGGSSETRNVDHVALAILRSQAGRTRLGMAMGYDMTMEDTVGGEGNEVRTREGERETAQAAAVADGKSRDWGDQSQDH
ncbi:uncharacterized protein N7496_009489 [Penicillium cataractarum]|uniref:Uncharacterized protein n=1 Tax=Penicillium cataractarum TaxID=2100454 RepID=A0A9W9V2H6_9EURO|nr:uncharacterized protein N7496_009489 [Penicillium cataractarum]KAJ5363776.1 hypothetical protein N7496_009489 [Penicillium cataractarum]